MAASSQYAAAQRFIKFVNASPTPYHAVKNAARRLEEAGFSKLLESEDNWDSALKNGGRFYFARLVFTNHMQLHDTQVDTLAVDSKQKPSLSDRFHRSRQLQTWEWSSYRWHAH